MKLKWVNIKNYRSCKDVKIEFESMHALVGANNAGKSTMNGPAASCRVSGLAYSNNLSCLREVLS